MKITIYISIMVIIGNLSSCTDEFYAYIQLYMGKKKKQIIYSNVTYRRDV